MKSNIDVLVNIGLADRAKDDALLVRDTCIILLSINQDEEKVTIHFDSGCLYFTKKVFVSNKLFHTGQINTKSHVLIVQ